MAKKKELTPQEVEQLKTLVPIFADHDDAQIIRKAYVDHKCDCSFCESLPHIEERVKDVNGNFRVVFKGGKNDPR